MDANGVLHFDGNIFLCSLRSFSTFSTAALTYFSDDMVQAASCPSKTVVSSSSILSSFNLKSLCTSCNTLTAAEYQDIISIAQDILIVLEPIMADGSTVTHLDLTLGRKPMLCNVFARCPLKATPNYLTPYNDFSVFPFFSEEHDPKGSLFGASLSAAK